MFLVLIVESARIPVDNPETHLELTMIHEAMILELSGSNLALVELASSIKQTIFGNGKTSFLIVDHLKRVIE